MAGAIGSVLGSVVAGGSANDSRPRFVFAKRDGTMEVVTVANLRALAASRGEALRQRGLVKGDVVLLASDDSSEVITWFLALMYIGALPCVFPCPTAKTPMDAYRARLASAMNRVAPRAILAPRLEQVVDSGFDSSWLLNADELRAEAERWQGVERPQRTNADDVAFIQLSSGSTGRQRAVAISHGALQNLTQMRNRALELTPETDVIVGWVPLYHDLGMVGGVLTALIGDVSSVIIDPFLWVRRPVTLMEAVHRYRCTVCTMPNFAFSYCARRIQDAEMQGLDLSHWRLLCNAAEPVTEDSLRLFAHRFAAWGFRRDALCTGYGLAENTLTATLTKTGQGIRTQRVNRRVMREQRIVTPSAPADPEPPLVSCGAPLAGVDLQVRSADGVVLGERCVGEIFMRSPSLFIGYWEGGSIVSDGLVDGWLPTGDLGYLDQGELYVCGRRKDVIIVDGHNVYPEDLEQVASRLDGLRPGRVVAFGVADEAAASERVVVIAELRAEAWARSKDIERELRLRMFRESDVLVGHVEFVPDDWIVKTSSGKIARWENRSKWLESRVT